MRGLLNMIMVLCIGTFLIPGRAFAQTMTTLQPRSIELERLKEEKEASQQTFQDVRFLKSHSPFIEKDDSKMAINQDECDMILTNRALDWHVHWGYQNDSGFVWFQAPYDLKVLAVRIRSSNWTGDILFDIWETPYTGDVMDYDIFKNVGESQEDLYIGDGNSPFVSFKTPLGSHVAGPVAKTISDEEIYTWVTIDFPEHPTFSKGDNFGVGMWFQQTDGWGFTADSPRGIPADLFKYYNSLYPHWFQPGWYIRAYHHEMELLVTSMSTMPPEIENVTELRTTLSTAPREVTATITDIDCAGGQAGITEVLLFYIFNDSDIECISMAANGDVYTAEIPGGQPEDEIHYFIEAKDFEDNISKSNHYYYRIFMKQHDLLWVYNGYSRYQGCFGPPAPLGLGYFYFYGTDYGLHGDQFVGFELDYWFCLEDGPVPSDLWDMYDKIVWSDHESPVTVMAVDVLAEWLETGTAQTPKCFYMSSQDYGCVLTNDCGDTVFDIGDPHFDYLGLAGIGPQDVSGGEDCYRVDPMVGDEVSGVLYDWMTTTPYSPMYYSPIYEMEFHRGASWADNITAAPHAEACFMDPATGNPMGVHVDGGHWKTTFLAFDELGLDLGEPCPHIWVISFDNVIGAAMNWCKWPADPVALSLKSKDMHDCEGNHWNTYEDCEGGENSIIIKPDSLHHVCIYFEKARPEYDVEVLHFVLTWDGGRQFLADIPTFERTCMDSVGWDIKWHLNGLHTLANSAYPDDDTLEIWLIGGGNAQEPLIEDKCILNLIFHVYDQSSSPEVFPGALDTISFLSAEFNEGSMAEYIDVGVDHSAEFYTIINRSPEITTSVPETVHVGEMEEICFTIEATDPDGDSLVMWNILDPYPCDGVQPDTVSGCGSVTMEWCWRPPKLGACDTLRDTTMVMSTFQTGQPLSDTLTTVIIVDRCEILAAWPDTSLFGCGWFEIPLRIHPDYDCLADLDLTSAYFEIDYDPDIVTVSEVGSEGLITDDWGVLTYNIDVENGTIAVAMAGNYPLSQCDPICTWYDFFYLGFSVNSGVTSQDSAVLSIEHVKFNEGEPTACWIDTTWLYFHDFSVRGHIFYSDTDTVWVPGAEISTVQTCDSDPSSIDTTDANGWFESLPWPGCSDFCLKPSKANDLTVEDQVVTSLDAAMILRSLCGQIVLSHNDSLAADVTGDGTVSAFDASVIMKWVVCEHCGSLPLSAQNIGDWIFEYYGDITEYHGEYCWCYDDLRADHLYELVEAVIIGDVTQNWVLDIAPKFVAGDLPVMVSGNTLKFTFSNAHAVDMTLRCEMEPVKVTANADLVEWARTAEGIRIAAAAVGGVSNVTVTFTELRPMMVEATALVNEIQVMKTTIKITRMPTEYALEQNYPNPFNPITDIRYQIPDNRSPAPTTLKIYNILGQEVRTLVNDAQKAGFYSVTWDGRNHNYLEVPSGIYFYRLNAGNFTSVKRMILMK
jgi:hypothetical protein